MNLDIFKAYDVRGRVPAELNEDIVYKYGLAFATFLKPKKVAIAYDVRPSSIPFATALTKGLTQMGVDVVNIGLAGSEELYFAVFNNNLDGGIMITASHNPSIYNGLKTVREKAIPIGSENGLEDIKNLIIEDNFTHAKTEGTVEINHDKTDYIRFLLKFLGNSTNRFKVVVNPGNGCAAPVLRLLEPHLPWELIFINETPDGSFPNGVPNPMLVENQKSTGDATIANNAHIGVAWDGDFDRCFFFDSKGRFVEGAYVVSLMAEAMLQRNPKATVVHEPRVTFNVLDTIDEYDGTPVVCKSGHAFLKQRMRDVDAIYAGEISAHHYFKDFSFSDSGMIAFLLMMQILETKGGDLTNIINKYEMQYPISGEINTALKPDSNPDDKINQLYRHFKGRAKGVDTTDGFSIDLGDVRLNVRKANTEPLIRLNVESRGNRALMESVTQEALSIIRGE